LFPDGNRRWAKEKGLPTFQGHFEGFQAARKLVRKAHEMGVHTVTLWVFSTENWNRSKEEVDYLFKKMGAGTAKHNIDMTIGESILITDGPFKDLEGKVNSIDQERGKVKVLVSMFGRETPVELDFLQVKKI